MSNWRLLALTASRAEVIRAIAADAVFTESIEIRACFLRTRICERVRQVLGDDCTNEEICHACCDESD